MVTTPVPPFVSDEDLDREDRALSVIDDVTVDVTSDCNVLPINHEVTSWESPVRELRGGRKPAQIIAIDNLPTLLPREASLDYSSQLLPALLTLPDGPIWERARETFAEHAAAAEAAASTEDRSRSSPRLDVLSAGDLRRSAPASAPTRRRQLVEATAQRRIPRVGRRDHLVEVVRGDELLETRDDLVGRADRADRLERLDHRGDPRVETVEDPLVGREEGRGCRYGSAPSSRSRTSAAARPRGSSAPRAH